MPGSDKQINDLQRAYQTLNVPTDATTISIKKAYRELLKRWHPDLNGNRASTQADANQMTKMINEAYSTIRKAPLRYYSDTSAQPRPERPVYRSPSQPKVRTLEPLNTARIEFWVRFVCGAILGFLVSLLIAVDALTDAAEIQISGVMALGLLLTCMIGFGFASARYGDRFWQTIIGRWLSWS
jgi:DnaJ domain